MWRGFALEGLITLDNQSRNFFLIVDSLKDCLHQNFVRLPSAVALVPRHGTPLICGLHPRGLHPNIVRLVFATVLVLILLRIRMMRLADMQRKKIDLKKVCGIPEYGLSLLRVFDCSGRGCAN